MSASFRLRRVRPYSAGNVLLSCEVVFRDLVLYDVLLLRDREDPNRLHVQAAPNRSVALKPYVLDELRAALLAEYGRHQNGEVA